MPFRRSRRPDEQTAERLLDTVATAGVDPPDEPVARLLAAAAASARPGELAGEDAALAAFRAVRTQRPAPVPPPRPRRTARAVAWLAGLTVVATAGVAVATVDLHRSDPPPAPPAPTTPAPAPPETAPTPTRTPSAATGTTVPPSGEQPRRSTSPRPAAQRGQCTAYLAKPAGQRAKALRTPAFGALVEAAGGPDQVEQYCRELLDVPPGRHPSPTARPRHDTRTGPPTARPSPPR
ncbi:hypothetical protein GA0070618_5496 [Micromonospora echinospora]|uniref:Uncharacterized protein n=1 Tax=Micromonospora echinospora TaxID=1877 RepID=A0A1C4ZN00_MICEC|nr:hypothetical protein [Micromonospora echinospora]SCF34259.1 hypothetical protein GA0070618_5496 [Micromonospora echinospora]